MKYVSFKCLDESKWKVEFDFYVSNVGSLLYIAKPLFIMARIMLTQSLPFTFRRHGWLRSDMLNVVKYLIFKSVFTKKKYCILDFCASWSHIQFVKEKKVFIFMVCQGLMYVPFT